MNERFDPLEQPRRPRRRIRRGVAVAVTVVLALLIFGGAYVLLGDDEAGTASGPAGSLEDRKKAAFEFAECVRDQGVADYPDPTVEADGGIFYEDLSDLGVPDEQLDAAQEACRHIMEEVRPGGAAATPEGAGSEVISPDGGPTEVQVPAPESAGWEEVLPGGDCRCADGSDYSFFVREANPERVVLFLDGGGACWSAETCAPDSINEYQTSVDGPNGEGIFDFADQRNPFADHSVVFVPYCTGDVHLGNATTEYDSGLTVEHKGYVNGTAALDHLTGTFPDATEVVVIGASAGGVSAPRYAAEVSDRLPGADITSIADSSGSFPDRAELNDILTGRAWGTTDALSDVAPGLRSMPGLYVSAAQRHPGIVFARYDHAYDSNQEFHVSLAGAPADDLLALIDANEAQIEDAGVTLHSYTAPGERHVVLADDDFYDETVDGTALVDWVGDILAGDQVGDVRCADCSTG